MTHRNPFVDAVVGELIRHGAEISTVDWTARHPHVHFTFRGRRQFYVTSGSPSDSHKGGTAKVRAEIRRVLGIKPVKRVGHKARRSFRRPKKTLRVTPPEITNPVRGLETLRAHPLHDLSREYRDAWRAYWAALKHDMGVVGAWWETSS